MDIMADTLIEVGKVEHGVVIHGCGLDEISPLGASEVLEIKNTAPAGEPKHYTKTRYLFDPRERCGVARCTVEDLKGGGAAENASLLRDALAGGAHTTGKRDAIVLNAGVGLYVFGLAASIEAGVALARATLESGAAIAKLDEWIATTQALKGQ
jgi:anthranilate phosphoribosyltransferase